MPAKVAVVKATELIPKAFNGTVAVPEEKSDDLLYDLHHLAAVDSHPVDLENFQANPEKYLLESATFGLQGIIDRLFELPYESSNTGPVVALPAATTYLPRAQRLPEAKKETRWEKFAKEKGITNKKRARMLWDEEAQEWRPRWGYNRAKGGVMDQAIVEVMPGDDPLVDPWTEARNSKRARVEKNLMQQAKNRGLVGVGTLAPGAKAGGRKGKKERLAAKGPAYGLPVDLMPTKKHEKAPAGTAAAAASAEGTKAVPKKKGKAAGLKALEVAQHSTASLGKFDAKLVGEPEKKVKKVRKVASVADSKALLHESKKMNSILTSVLRPKGGSGGSGKTAHVNIDALEPERAGYARKKGRGAVKGGGKKKK
ncbi:ribosome biogenesis regulatory protein [Nannochloropsis oceanica]